MKITVKKNYIEYLSRFCSVDAYRYYLQGIHFNPAENALEATDGHQLGRIKNGFTSDSELPEGGYIINFSKNALSILKKLKFEEIELEIIAEGRLARFDCMSDSFTCEIIDGQFPDVNRVFPTNKPEAQSGMSFNADYMKNFKYGKSKQVIFTFYGADAPAGVTVPDLPEFEGLLMPMRY